MIVDAFKRLQWETEADRERDAVRARLKAEGRNGPFLSTEELTRDYEVNGFAFGFCDVTRKSDGQRGTFDFVHWPRIYYDWKEAVL